MCGFFFLLTSCSHPGAYKPALSKESALSEHVNTRSKSTGCSHVCSYFRAANLHKNVNKTSSTEWKTALDQHKTPSDALFLLNSERLTHLKHNRFYSTIPESHIHPGEALFDNRKSLLF